MDTTALETALYLIPCTLGDTSIEKVLPSYNHDIIMRIRYFIVEDVRSARRFLKKVDREINIDELTFYELNKHTSSEAIASYLVPLQEGYHSQYYGLRLQRTEFCISWLLAH